jgi:hypothetical protein
MVKAEFTVKSDVWSWAILAIEIYTDGTKPFPTVTNADLPMQIMGGLRPMQPTNTCPNAVYELIETCWKLQPIDRPDFDTLRNKMRKIKESGVVLPVPKKGAHSGSAPAFNNDYADFNTSSSDGVGASQAPLASPVSGTLSDDYEMPTNAAATAPIEVLVDDATAPFVDQGRSRYVSTGFVRTAVDEDEAIPCKYGCGHTCDAKDQAKLPEHEASCTSFYTAVDSVRALAGGVDSAPPPTRRLSGPLKSNSGDTDVLQAAPPPSTDTTRL